MATKTQTTFIGFLILILIFHFNFSTQVSAKRTRTKAHHHLLQANESLHSRVSPSCASSPLPQGGLKISHRYGPCSPQGQKQGKKQGSHDNLSGDQSRVSSIDSQNTAGADATGTNYAVDSSDHGEGIVVPTSGRLLDGNYLVAIGLGTPKRDFNIIFDTGSELSWVKCQPDGGGGDVYDPNASSTSDATCDSSSCDYTATYLDGSSSRGRLVKDKLTIAAEQLAGFTFGCSETSSDGFGQAAGILALGQSDDHALISQTSAFYGQIFCHCLPTRGSSNGYLLFGKGAIEQCRRPNNQVTAVFSNPNSPHQYSVNFIGITIGGVRFSWRTSSSSSSQGTMMDSGTPITHLPARVYEGLKSVFVRSMAGYSRAPPADALDTCYNLQGTPNGAMIPEVVLHFEDMDLRLGLSAIVWMEKGLSQVCLAFAAKKKEEDMNIIGNHQQRGLNVLYNVQGNRVEFGPGSCGN